MTQRPDYTPKSDAEIDRIISSEFSSNSSQHQITKRKKKLQQSMWAEKIKESDRFVDQMRKNGRTWTGY